MAAVTFGRWSYVCSGGFDHDALEWAAQEVLAELGRGWPLIDKPVVRLYPAPPGRGEGVGTLLDRVVGAALDPSAAERAPVQLLVAADQTERRVMVAAAADLLDAWSADEVLRRALRRCAQVGTASVAHRPTAGEVRAGQAPGASPPDPAVTSAPGADSSSSQHVAQSLRLSRETLTRLRRVAARADLAGVLAAACALVDSRHRGSPHVRVELRLPGREPRRSTALGTLERAVTVGLDVDERRGFADLLRQVQAALADGVAAPIDGADIRVIVEPRADVWARPPLHIRREPLAAVLAAPNARGGTFLVASGGAVIAAVRTQPGQERTRTAALGHLERVLTQVAQAPDRQVRELDMLSADERHRIVVGWNATDRPYPRNGLMHALFERHARARPDAVAVVRGDHRVSYRALAARANGWARRLVALGAGPERFVGVRLSRTPELVAVMLGVLKSGAAYVPLDPSYPSDRLAFMAQDSRLTVLVADDEATVGDQHVTVVRPTDAVLSVPAERVSSPRTRPDSAAYVLYTSGSTGRPKGVVMTHVNATDLLYWAAEVFGEDLPRVLATTSICFDCSILEIFAPLSWGGTVVLADSALDAGARAVGHDLRLMHTVPSVMAELLRLGNLPASLATVLLGGETPWPRLIDDVYRHSAVRRLLNLYGPTECTSYATMALVRPRHDGSVPIGQPVANTRIRLLDRYGNTVPVGAPGEIYIGGAGVARGYLHRPGLTAERFVPDPFADLPGERLYRTGDLARYGDDGTLTFLGRVDDQIKVRGVRVEPAEVERALLEHPDVAEAAVIAPDDGPSRRRLVAYLVGRPASLPAAAQMREFLSARLPAALVPDAYVVLDVMPRQPNGKLDRRRLPAETSCARAPYVAPRDDLEAAVVTQWADALNLADLSIYDDVYELGGQSLAALRVRARLSDTLAIEVPVEVLFTRHTAASLAEGIRELTARGAGGQRAAAPAMPGRRAGPAPLSPNQAAVLARVRRDPDDWTMHLPLCVRVRGDLRPSALRLAFTELIRRQGVLRTRIEYRGGRPCQTLAPAAAAALPIVDLSALPAREREAVAVELSVAAARAPFDVRQPPLVHATLFRLDASDHVLAVTLHQIVADVWSMEAVGQQLLDLYQMAAGTRRPRFIEPPVRYHDWARWQRSWLRSPRGRAQRQFWLSRLAAVPPLVLPPGRPRQPSGKTTAGTHAFGLSGELVSRLTRLASQESATLHIALLAAFGAALGAWSGQSDFVVGCPTSGRTHPELDSVVGPFINALVIRADLSGNPSYRDLLRRTRDRSWEAYSHQAMPFAQLVTDLAADHDPTRHPVYQTSIVVHYLAPDADVPAGLDVTDFGRRPPPMTALDVELAIYVGHDGAECSVTFRRDLFNEEEIARFAAGYVRLLESASTTPDELVPLAPTAQLLTPAAR